MQAPSASDLCAPLLSLTVSIASATDVGLDSGEERQEGWLSTMASDLMEATISRLVKSGKGENGLGCKKLHGT
jgi:hypothetical protein